jgi:hypothetical protein
MRQKLPSTSANHPEPGKGTDGRVKQQHRPTRVNVATCACAPGDQLNTAGTQQEAKVLFSEIDSLVRNSGRQTNPHKISYVHQLVNLQEAWLPAMVLSSHLDVW